MKVSFQNNKISFTSTPIHRVNLPRVNGKGFVEAVFSKLDPKDKVDQTAMREIERAWGEKCDLAGVLARNFFKMRNNEEVYAVELIDGNKPLEEKIVGLSLLGIQKNIAGYFSALVTKPELSHHSYSFPREIKNIGVVLLGALLNTAKKENVSSLQFTSLKNGFYSKVLGEAGIKADFSEPCPLISLTAQDLKTFVNHWKNKFSINL